MSKLSPQQIDRALGVAECLVAFAAEVYRDRKLRNARPVKLVGPAKRKAPKK